MAHKKDAPPPNEAPRRYRSRGVNVEIGETKPAIAMNREGQPTETRIVDLKLDGKPIHVSVIDGKYHCQLANQFTAFESVDDIVETLLANEGRTWTLHGHLCDERCSNSGHHHENNHGHVDDQGHDHDQGGGGGR